MPKGFSSADFPYHQVIKGTAENFLTYAEAVLDPDSFNPLYEQLVDAMYPFDFTLYDHGLWIQNEDRGPLVADAPFNFSQMHTSHFPETSIATLKKLDKTIIQGFFEPYKISDLMVDLILTRRDMVMRAYEAAQKNVSKS